MKTYIGTKIIQAQTMNRGDYNKYRGWTIPENENPADEGYLVKYSDNYESWSPKAVFEESYREYRKTELPSTAIMMQSDDYKERFKAEYIQLAIRHKKLKNMLENWDNGLLNFTPSCPRNLYRLQIDAMEKYLALLEARALIEGIEL